MALFQRHAKGTSFDAQPWRAGDDFLSSGIIFARSALRDEKSAPTERMKFVLTGPSNILKQSGETFGLGAAVY